MIDKEIWNSLKLGLDRLYENDQYLICRYGNNYVSERAITFNLGHYLNNIFKEIHEFKYSIDCEFNRDIDEVKKMGKHDIIPDIIIHERGSNKDNLVAIEVKTWWNNKNEERKRDEDKLFYLTDSCHQYKYKYGFSLIINKNREDTEIKIFIDGKTDDIYHKI